MKARLLIFIRKIPFATLTMSLKSLLDIGGFVTGKYSEEEEYEI